MIFPPKGIDRGLFMKVDMKSGENGGSLKKDTFGIKQGIYIQGKVPGFYIS